MSPHRNGGSLISKAKSRTGIYIKIREELLKDDTIKMPFYKG